MKQMKINIALFAGILALSGACTSKKPQQSPDTNSALTETKPDSGKTATVFDNVDPSVKTDVSKLLTNYFDMIHALVNDNESGTKEGAKKLADNLHGFDASGLPQDQKAFYDQRESRILRSLDDIARSATLDEVREATASVSDELYQLTKAFHGNTADIYYNYCPMARDNAGAYWLSDVSEIQNPYMGQSMPGCGSTKEVLK